MSEQKIRNTAPIHPTTVNVNGQEVTFTGMTLRQWYKGMAMIGLLASEANGRLDRMDAENAASLSARMADAMLEEDQRTQEQTP